MATVKLGTLKQGDTFSCYIDFADGTTPITGVASKLKCQVRDSNDTLLSTLNISEDAEKAGRYILQTTTLDETRAWGTMVYMDIEYTDGNIRRSTDTLSLIVEKDVTKDE